MPVESMSDPTPDTVMKLTSKLNPDKITSCLRHCNVGELSVNLSVSTAEQQQVSQSRSRRISRTGLVTSGPQGTGGYPVAVRYKYCSIVTSSTVTSLSPPPHYKKGGRNSRKKLYRKASEEGGNKNCDNREKAGFSPKNVPIQGDVVRLGDLKKKKITQQNRKRIKAAPREGSVQSVSPHLGSGGLW